MNWTYDGYIVDSIPEGMYGFIYKITYTDGTYYYGKKNFYSTAKKWLGKKELALQTDKRLKKYKYVSKETKWQDYEGSSKLTKDLTISSKEILAYAVSKIELTYLETKCLFQTEALEDDLCRNENINGKWYKGNIT